MIAQSYITEWSEVAPWGVNAQVEQDLIICRALCSIYSDEFLADTDLILGPEVEYDAAEAWEVVKGKLVERLRKE